MTFGPDVAGGVGARSNCERHSNRRRGQAAGGQHHVMNLLSEAVVYVDSTASVRDMAVRRRSADVSLAVAGVVSMRDLLAVYLV